MNECPIQRGSGKRRRGIGVGLWACALACLIILACVGTPFVSRKSGSDQQLPQSPESAVGVKDARLNFVPVPASQVELQGNASIGSWNSKSTDIHGKVILDTDASALNALFDRIQSAVPGDENRIQPNLLTLSVLSPAIAEISVPVMSLRGDSAGMDRDMQSALKAPQHPAIEYVFQQVQQASLQWDPQSHQTALKLSAIGKLNMAGADKPITMDVILKRDSREHFIVHAQTSLLMTDFGVTPPGALFGLIKAEDKVNVIFDLDLVLADHPSEK
jgi:hypothetical protein